VSLLTPGQIAAEASGHVREAYIVDMLIGGENTVRGSLAGIDIVVDGVTYKALNTLRGIDTIKTNATSIEGVALQFGGVNAAIIGLATSMAWRGKPLNIYRVYLDENYQPIDDKRLLFPGLISGMPIRRSGLSLTVSVQAEHLEMALRNPRPLYYNSATQHMQFPDDAGFDDVEALTEKIVVWPRKELLL
jgi:hypothetical protein